VRDQAFGKRIEGSWQRREKDGDAGTGSVHCGDLQKAMWKFEGGKVLRDIKKLSAKGLI